MLSRIVAMIIVMIASLLVVFVMVFYAGKRWNRSAGIIIAGALGFFIPQVLIRIPLLQIFNEAFSNMGIISLALVLGLSAALFETTGRYIVIGQVCKHRCSMPAGISAGIGHGCCEMFFALVITYLNNLILINVKIEGIEEIADMVAAQIAETPLILFAAAFWERLCVIAVQILLSLLLMEGFRKKKRLTHVILVFALHALLDIATVLINNISGVLWAEIFVTLFAAACLLALWHIVRRNRCDMDLPEDEGKIAVKEGY